MKDQNVSHERTRISMDSPRLALRPREPVPARFRIFAKAERSRIASQN